MQKYDVQVLEQSHTLTEFLESEFLRRMRKNPSYSLRAFARDLGVSSSRVSEVFSSKRGISQQTLARIVDRLQIKKSHQFILQDLFLLQSTKSSSIKENALQRLKEFWRKNRIKRLDKQHFRILSEWYHAALVELTQIKGFKNDSAWMADRLGVSKTQVEFAVRRLIEAGLLTEVEGQLQAQPDIVITNSDSSFEAISHYHKQMIQKAQTSLEKDSTDVREFNSMIVAIPSSELPEFRKQMQNFMQTFWQGLEDKPKDDLYSLNIQFFPVMRK
jgi:uncharacterized protein (TIGR02147 family)